MRAAAVAMTAALLALPSCAQTPQARTVAIPAAHYERLVRVISAAADKLDAQAIEIVKLRSELARCLPPPR